MQVSHIISQSVEYALRAMSHLASRNGVAANCEVIARATRVPQGYLSKIMGQLVRAGLVQSFRGPGGGFILSRGPESITVHDVICAVDPIRRISNCPLGNPQHDRLCPLHQCLDDAMAQVEATFRGTNLADVLGHDQRHALRSDLRDGPQLAPEIQLIPLCAPFANKAAQEDPS